MIPATPLTMSSSIKLLVQADSGWGKTRLLGTSPGRNLIIRPPTDMVDSILAKDKPRCSQWIADDWSEMEDIEESLRMEGKKNWDWVWFDSISGYQDIGLDDLWDTIITENPRRKRHGLDKGDYGINMQRLGRWVRNIVAIADTGAFNFGITAWPKELEPSPDDPDREAKLMPWVQGKNMSSKVCGYMNVIAFGDLTSKGTRVLRFMETPRYVARTQFDDQSGPGTFKGADYKILNPDMPKIIEMIDKSRGTTRKATKATTPKRHAPMHSAGAAAQRSARAKRPAVKRPTRKTVITRR